MRYEELMTNRRKDKTSETALKIFEAAKELFLKSGFCNVTVRDIARLADVNQALIPYYYTSKDQLANKVYLDFTDEVFTRYQNMISEISDSAEQMYVYTVLSTEYGENIARDFMYEFLECCNAAYTPSNGIRNLSRKVLAEYKRPVTPAENEIYLTSLIGTERFLYIRRHQGEIDISTEKISDIIISDYFFNIGLSDQSIADIISNCKDFLKKYHKIQGV